MGVARSVLLDTLSSDDEKVRFEAADVLGTLEVMEQRMLYERERPLIGSGGKHCYVDRTTQNMEMLMDDRHGLR